MPTEPKPELKRVQPQEGQSADLVAENIERLRELFPEAVTEGPEGISEVDFDVLHQLLGDAGEIRGGGGVKNMA